MDIRPLHTSSFTVGPPVQQQRRDAPVPADTPPVREQQPASPQRHPVLTAEEQRFFEGLFPDAAGDLHTHQAYTVDGTRSAAVAGAIIDRRI